MTGIFIFSVPVLLTIHNVDLNIKTKPNRLMLNNFRYVHDLNVSKDVRIDNMTFRYKYLDTYYSEVGNKFKWISPNPGIFRWIVPNEKYRKSNTSEKLLRCLQDITGCNLETNNNHSNRTVYNNHSNRTVFHFELMYPQFNLTLPKFLSEEDQQIFLAVKLHSDLLKSTKWQGNSFGNIAYIHNGTLTGNAGCGWHNNVSNYAGPPLADSQSMHINPKQYVIQHKDDYIISPLFVPEGNTFQHFMDGVMPKLAQLSPFLTNPRIKFMLHIPRDKIIQEILIKIGIGLDRVMFVKQTSRIVRMIQHQLVGCIAPPLHPILWHTMRELMGVSNNIQVPMTQAIIILLTRAQSHNGGRNILNIQQISTYLRQRYSDRFVVFKGGYGLKESMDLFGRARLVIGVHGGAFYNINFCPMEAIVAEYHPVDKTNGQPPKRSSLDIVWKMAQMIGQGYYRLSEKAVSNKGDLNISFYKFKLLLDKVDYLQLRVA